MINLNSKLSQSKKNNKLFDLHKNSYILSLPSVLGIVLAIAAIPIHLQTNGKSDYGNYIFFHYFRTSIPCKNLPSNKLKKAPPPVEI